MKKALYQVIFLFFFYFFSIYFYIDREFWNDCSVNHHLHFHDRTCRSYLYLHYYCSANGLFQKRKKTTHTYCQILSNLSASMTNISTRNRNLHRILVKVVQFSKRGKIQQNNKALTIHACLPLLSSFAVLIYLIRLFDIYYHPSLEKAITTVSQKFVLTICVRFNWSLHLFLLL